MKLYHLEGCPYCAMVRRRLDELGLAYQTIEVPMMAQLRAEVIEVSGQPFVPVLVDGEVVLEDENKIIEYLDMTYGKEPSGDGSESSV